MWLYPQAVLKPFVYGFRGLVCASALLVYPLAGSAADTALNGYHAVPAILSSKAVTSLLTDVQAAGNRLIAVGARGHILVSDDQGRSWQQSPVPSQELLTAVFFVDSQHGWAVGHQGLILHSADAGNTWQIQHANPYVEPDLNAPINYDDGPDTSGQPLLDVWFKNPQEGFAVGAFGQFLHTDDGGKHWQDWSKRLDNIDAWHLNALASSDGQHLYIVGEMGTLFHSKDAGENWQKLTSPYEGSFFGLLVADSKHLWVFGLQGRVFKSLDSGVSWQSVEVDTSNGLMSGLLRSPEGIVIVGNNGVMLFSDDGGEHFRKKVAKDRQSIIAVAQNKQGKLVFAGKSGVHVEPDAH